MSSLPDKFGHSVNTGYDSLCRQGKKLPVLKVGTFFL